MVLGWRRAFCTSSSSSSSSKQNKKDDQNYSNKHEKNESESVPPIIMEKDDVEDDKHAAAAADPQSNSSSTSKLKMRSSSSSTNTRLGGFFFSNPSTPRLRLSPQPTTPTTPPVVVVSSPKLRCKTTPTTSTTNGTSSNSTLSPTRVPIFTTTTSTSTPTKIQNMMMMMRRRSSPRFFNSRSSSSAPSSPRSPSTTTTFSFLKSTLAALSKSSSSSNRCGICLEIAKTGQGTAIFTAECNHIFHFSCIASHLKPSSFITTTTTYCPICNSPWQQHQPQNTSSNNTTTTPHNNINNNNNKRCNDPSIVLKVYNDDEPLSSPTSRGGPRFHPILESDETDHHPHDEFPGFSTTTINNNNIRHPIINQTHVHHHHNHNNNNNKKKVFDISLSSESAVISIGKTTHTYALVLRLKYLSTPPPPSHHHRPPIDIVTVINVAPLTDILSPDKLLKLIKSILTTLISSLSPSDRFSIIAFSSSTSKRLLPLRRMSSSGKRSALKIIQSIVSLNSSSSSSSVSIDSLKKAAKVLHERREINPTSTIFLFSDGGNHLVNSTRFSGIPLHTFSLRHAPDVDTVSKCVSGLLLSNYEVVHDVRIQIGFGSGLAPGEISAVYSYVGKPAFLGSGSSWCRVGDIRSNEERELLVELKVPTSLLSGAQPHLAVRCCYRDPSTQLVVYDDDKERLLLLVPRPRAVGSSTREIQRLRCLFITTRAVAESRRLLERGDMAGAHYLLASARALVLQSGSGMGSGEEFVRGLEVEIAELNWKRDDRLVMREQTRRTRNNDRHQRGSIMTTREEEKVEALTPTSAWRAAERLAKVAIMRKSLNRVSYLHGFENARF